MRMKDVSEGPLDSESGSYYGRSENVDLFGSKQIEMPIKVLRLSTELETTEYRTRT